MKKRLRRLKWRFGGKKGRTTHKRRPPHDLKKTAFRLKISAFVLLALGALCFLLLNIENRLYPLLTDTALSNLNSIVLRECSDAVAEAVAKSGADYDDLINKTTDSGGNIKSVSVNYAGLNQFKSSLAKDIQSRIDKINSVDVYVPVMSMFSDSFYSALGFPIKIKVLTDENIQVDFEDKFESAGINQTRHFICVKITAEMGVNLPVRKSGDDIVTEIPIAETIISGETPTVSVGD